MLNQTETMPTFVGLQFWTSAYFGLTAVEDFYSDLYEVQTKETGHPGQVLFSLLWTKQKKNNPRTAL